MYTLRSVIAAGLGVLIACWGASELHAQKYGGVMRAILNGSPPSLSLHEETTNQTTWPMVPVYNNLVFYDVFKPVESFDTIVPDLAESWNWSADNRSVTFILRPGVKWHDGKPFTSADVKHTYDTLREVGGKKLKLNPRKNWYANVAEVVTQGDREVTFRLKRIQPSIVAILAGGYSAVYPAHIAPRELRTTAMGTGPFRLKSYTPDRNLVLEKNREYFVRGRPYLDGVEFPIIKELSSMTNAMIAKQADVNMLSQTTRPVMETMRAAHVGLAFVESITNTTFNIIVNTKKPPFIDPELRRAVNLAMNREALIKTVFNGGAAKGGALQPVPWGAWGLSPAQMEGLPGYGDSAKNKAEAREILTRKGYTAANPLRFKVLTRNQAVYVRTATWVIGELKAVGVEAELDKVEVPIYYGKVARREFVFGMNATAADEPDITFFEHYACNAIRNYSEHCDPDLERKFQAQSMEVDQQQRKRMVNEIDIQMQMAGIRPMMVYRGDYYAHWPHVKNFIPHQNIYNAFRFQEVWLDR